LPKNYIGQKKNVRPKIELNNKSYITDNQVIICKNLTKNYPISILLDTVSQIFCKPKILGYIWKKKIYVWHSTTILAFIFTQKK